MPKRAWGPLCATLLLLVAGSARAFNVPKQTDYVTDTASVLSAAELADLDNRLGDYERKTGNQIFVLVTPSLEGEPIEDVGYQLIQTWRPGQKGKDNGVVLIIATGERRIRIETGKGVGGDLTDLQSNDIIRRRIAPLMRENRVHDAILSGIDGIAAASEILRKNPAARIVFVTVHDEAEMVQKGMAIGVLGYVLKLTAGEDLIPAIYAALRGERHISRLIGRY
jgi:Beta-propeller domains of methanol dehydrogenase type